MKFNTTKLLGFVLIAIIVPITGLAKSQRQILGHALAKQCTILPSGGDGSPSAEQCSKWSVPSTVTVYTDDLELVTQVTSDSDGYFEISDLKPGIYVLVVSAITPHAASGRYFPVVQTMTLHKKQETPFDFFLGYRPD